MTNQKGVAKCAEKMGTFLFRNGETGDIISVRANWCEASSPIYYGGKNGVEDITPFQVADARHNQYRALALVLNYLESNGADYGDIDDFEEMEC